MLEFRPALPSDLSILKAWDEKEHVIASDPNDDWNWEVELQKSPDWREFWMATWEDRPIGFLQIIDPHLEETHYWGDIAPNQRAIDIWIGEEEFLGKGFGTKMMEFAIQRSFADPSVTAIWVDPLESNTDAIRFYEKMGFRFVEKRQFGLDHCLTLRLDRSVSEAREGLFL